MLLKHIPPIKIKSDSLYISGVLSYFRWGLIHLIHLVIQGELFLFYSNVANTFQGFCNIMLHLYQPYLIIGSWVPLV